jgi:DNA uptake protein ComE-like DNA-binding protein
LPPLTQNIEGWRSCGTRAETLAELAPPSKDPATLPPLSKRRPDSENPADAWLPEGLKRRSHDTRNGEVEIPASNGAADQQTSVEAQHWLAGSKSTQSVAEGDGALKQRVSDLERELDRARKELDEARKAKDAIERRLGKEHEKREADLEKRFSARQAALEQQLDEVEGRLDGSDAVFREQAKDRERTLNKRIEELESVLAEAQQRAIGKPTRRGSRRKGKLDLNEVTFEQLRDMGLSVTLSARVMAYRDTRGAFQSLDELNEIPGLSVELKRVLSEKLTVD